MENFNIIKNNNEYLEITFVGVSENDAGSAWLMGEVKNISSLKLGYVGVVVAIKDKDGQMLDCALEYVLGNSDLAIGDTGYFKCLLPFSVSRLSELQLVVKPFHQNQE